VTKKFKKRKKTFCYI